MRNIKNVTLIRANRRANRRLLFQIQITNSQSQSGGKKQRLLLATKGKAKDVRFVTLPFLGLFAVMGKNEKGKAKICSSEHFRMDTDPSVLDRLINLCSLHWYTSSLLRK